MSEVDNNVTELRPKTVIQAATVTIDPVPELPKGPYVVTVSDPDGKMFEIELDEEGCAHPDVAALMTGGPAMQHLVVNLMTGALRIFAGRVR